MPYTKLQVLFTGLFTGLIFLILFAGCRDRKREHPFESGHPDRARNLDFSSSSAAPPPIKKTEAKKSGTDASASSVKDQEPLAAFDLIDLKKSDGLPEVSAVKIKKDPVYEKSKSFEAFSLIELIKALSGKDLSELDPNTQVKFICADGYTTSASLSKVKKGKAFIAVRDKEAPEGKDWIDLKQHGGNLHSPKPFYLIWASSEMQNARKYPWPYNLTNIELLPVEGAFGDAYPYGAPEKIKDAFLLFKQNCMSCHAVNKSGGSIGPELNVPRNVTTYWKESELAAFIKDPKSYRYNSKMASNKHLSDAQINSILDYLKYMKGKKVSL